MKSYLTKKKFLLSLSILTALLLAAIYFGLSHGSGSIDIFEAAFGGTGGDILFGARLPRVLLAALVGMALASSGGAFQTLLKNPLADPFILGVSGGAALGSIAALGFKLPFLWMDESPERRRRVRQGEILAAPVVESGRMRVPQGLIHHWVGAVFIPDASLDHVFGVVHDYDHYRDYFEPTVIASKLLSRSDNQWKFGMRWLNSSFYAVI